jgi:hypothetical protein
MSKILKNLNYQLKTEFKHDAEKVKVIYDYLIKKYDGHIWESKWNPLVSTNFIGKYPYYKKVYSLTDIGEMVFKQLTNENTNKQ